MVARPRDHGHQGRREARPAARHGKTKAEVTAKVRKLEKLRDKAACRRLASATASRHG